MPKRPVADDGKSRHAKKRYFPDANKQRNATSEFKQGLHGLLITCDTHLERKAVRECINLLEQLVGDGSTDTTADCSSAGATAGSALAQELAELQQERPAGGKGGSKGSSKGGSKGPRSRFSIAQTPCNGCVFIKFEDRSLDPVALADRIFGQVLLLSLRRKQKNEQQHAMKEALPACPRTLALKPWSLQVVALSLAPAVLLPLRLSLGPSPRPFAADRSRCRSRFFRSRFFRARRAPRTS